VLGETDPQTTIWELLLPEEAKRLPTELAAVDAYLDDERFIAPWRGCSPSALAARRSRSTPAAAAVAEAPLPARRREPVPRGQRFDRVAAVLPHRPGPARAHPTTLIKLVRRAGPETIEQLNAALVAKLAGKLLRARKLRVDTTVSRPTSIIRPTPTCWSMRSASSVGWCGASRPAVPPAGLGSGTGDGPLAGG
jgi:transposase, IS5 family